MKRCPWAESKNPLMVYYHDTEWGVPVFNDQTLFEFLILEGAQAGLSWETILNKRKGYRDASYNFNAARILKEGIDVTSLLTNPNIIRNRRKIESIYKNATRFEEIKKEYGSFSVYLWRFVDNEPIQNSWKHQANVPIVTKEAHALSKDLKRRGFSFVGPTICYAYMQAVGMVNDHTTDCFRHKEVQKLGTTHVK